MTKLEITDETAANVAELVLPFLTEQEYSAYGIATVLNKILAMNGREAVRPQMMYNYARNGLIVKGEKVSGVTLRKFTRDEVASFIVRYGLRNGLSFVPSGTETNPDQLELDLEI